MRPVRTASRLNSSLCLVAISGLLDGEYRSQKTGTKPGQVHDFDGRIGAGRVERGDGRQTYRSGYRDRELKTPIGALNLRVPKLQTGLYFPGFLKPRRTSEKALAAVIQGEADQPGVRWTHGLANGAAASRRAKSTIWRRRRG
jgi:hypothetical protein